jgi:hypothetical protein
VIASHEPFAGRPESIGERESGKNADVSAFSLGERSKNEESWGPKR